MSSMSRIDLADARLCWDAPLGVEKRTGGLIMCRFPRERLEADGCETQSSSRLRTPTGCSLRMVTDARKIAFGIRVIDTPRDWGSFVVRCEGEVIGLFERPDFAPGQCHSDIDLAGNGSMREIEVLPPHLIDFLFESISIDGQLADMPAPAARKPVWLAIGDSITQGMNARRSDLTYVQRVCDALSIAAWNLGIGGAQMDLSLFEWALSRRPWKIVTVALGGNDFIVGKPLDEFRRDTRGMADAVAAAAPGAHLVMITPVPIVKAGFGQGISLDEYRAAIASVAAGARQPCTLVDGHTIVDTDKDHHTSDGVHLSDNGFAVYAERLAPRIAEALGMLREN